MRGCREPEQPKFAAVVAFGRHAVVVIEPLRQLYRDFNKRDIDAVLAVLADDVSWPDMINRRFIHGHGEVRAYWELQWQMIDPDVTPLEFERADDDQIHVRVSQTIRDLEGNVLDTSEPVHEYRFANDRVAEMIVRGEDLND